MWHHTFYNELRVAPEENFIFHCIGAQSALSEKEKTTQIMFETFNALATYLELQPVLSFYASGRTTGLLLGNPPFYCFFLNSF